jgi:hypothetical protein
MFEGGGVMADGAWDALRSMLPMATSFAIVAAKELPPFELFKLSPAYSLEAVGSNISSTW